MILHKCDAVALHSALLHDAEQQRVSCISCNLEAATGVNARVWSLVVVEHSVIFCVDACSKTLPHMLLECYINNSLPSF